MAEPVAVEPVYALLIDGTTVSIREVAPGDLDAVRDLHRGMSPDNLYLRFFGISRGIADEVAARLCREPDSDHAVLGAWLAGHLIGIVEYESTAEAGAAEIALAVADEMHNRGVGTLLLEHLVSLARSRNVHAFHAETLVQNIPMLRMFACAGLPVQRHTEFGVVEVTIPLTGEDGYLDAVAERERHADIESLRHLLSPA